MYKLLPILLFVFVFSQTQYKKDLFLQDDPKVLAFKMLLSDMHDTAYVPTDYNSYIDYLKQVKENEINIKVNGLIGGNMFSVKTNFEIIDTAYCNEKSECIPNLFSNIVVGTFSIAKPDTNYSPLILNGNECQYAYRKFGSTTCDTAWDEYGINCRRLESNYNWDCSGCNCLGDDKDFDPSGARGDIPNCLLNCPGFANLMENEGSAAEVCNWYNTSWVENECLNECENDTDFLSEMIGELKEMCDCSSQIWDGDDNCIRERININKPFLEKSTLDCDSCEFDFTNLGSECCDTAWDEYGINCAELEHTYYWNCSGCQCPGENFDSGNCDFGYVEDCVDEDCCPQTWIGDGFADCEDQAYGCDLTCYYNDYGDCHYLKPKIEKYYSNQGLNIELIYNQVVKSYPNNTFYNSVNSQSEYGIITGKLKVTVYHDENVRLASYRSNVIDLIKSSHPSLPNCKDCISFTSVDMDSLRGVNEKVNRTISLNRDDIYDDSWAVIIGIDKYKYSKQLNYAVKDAESVKDILINKFDYPEENIRYLTDEQATLSNIKFNLGEVATSAGENDRILVFYSGHGETLKGADGSETGYIIPYEGRQDNPYATGLVMDEILRTCQISQSKHMLFLMDACYSGLMTENVKGLSKPQDEGYLSKVANEKARQIITAGGRDEQVIERDEWQHSAFTKNLLEGLEDWGADYNKDGCITADELSTYLREHVTEDSDSQQTPQDGRFRNSGGGEFVFFGRGDNQTISDVSLIKEEKDENLKEELFNSYEYDKEFIREFKKHKKEDVISKLVNNPPKSTHSFLLHGYQYNKSFLNSKKEWSFSYFVINDLDYAFAVGIKNFGIEERKGLYWGYNLLLLGTLKNAGLHNPIHKLYLGEPGLLPSVEFGYRLRMINSLYYGISEQFKKGKKMRPYYIIIKLISYPIKDELFNLPINELYKGIDLYLSVGMEFPIFWWKENLK